MGTTSCDTGLLLLAGDRLDDAAAAVHRRRAQALPYSTLGMLQFIAPTLQFLIAVLIYGEPFTRAHAIAFAAIWIALGLYVTALLRAPRLPQPPE